MESVNYNELATLVLALCCIVVLLTFGVVYAAIRIGQIQSDIVREDEAVEYNLIKEINQLRSGTHEMVSSCQSDINSIKDQLNQPLYEVGNTIWYNRAEKGKNGAFIDYDGVIKEILTAPNHEPVYIVDGHEGKGVRVSQNLITAWTN